VKYYPPSNHIYYENSDVPINKLDIKDPQLIHELERELLFKAYEYFHIALSEETLFDALYFREVHKLLFSELYAWAGEFRSVNISKGESMFYPAINLADFSNDIFIQLSKENYLRDFEAFRDREAFAKRLAYYMCELIVLHPFNEGNGRALRLFFDMIVTYNGYDYIDYAETLEGNDFISASIDCMQTECSKMEKIILVGLSKSQLES